jgi:hypothetical protein
MKDVVPIIDRQELNTSKKQEYGTLLYLTRGRLRTGIQNDNPQSGELGRPIQGQRT